MSKYVIALLIMLLIALFFLIPIHSYQNFDDNFYMNTNANEHYKDVAWCKPCGELGCSAEYWADDSGCRIDGDEVVIYYYNESILLDGENSVYQHTYDTLTNSYLYKYMGEQNGLTFFESTIDMKNVPHYLVCAGHGNEVVGVGSENSNKAKEYAESVTL